MSVRELVAAVHAIDRGANVGAQLETLLALLFRAGFRVVPRLRRRPRPRR